MTISLNQNQIDIISAAVLIKDYHSAYLAVANALEENKNHLEYDEQQLYWFQQAASINQYLNRPEYMDTPSLSGYFIEQINLISGKDSAEIIKMTNKIAEIVLNEILTTGSIPSMETQINDDISVALNEGGLKYSQWSGAFYYWDTKIQTSNGKKTIGELIIENNLENEFINTTGKALARVYKEHGLIFDYNAIVGALKSFNDSQYEVVIGGAVVGKFIDSYLDISEHVNNVRNELENYNLKAYLGLDRIGQSFYYDPLILDLDGDGIETIAHENLNGPMFDNDADGLKVATGWVASDDGLLVYDRNNDGLINNGTEVFGDNTDLQNGNKATHGFEALADLDENKDGIINSDDSLFSSLKVWKDLNKDGVSQNNELFTLQSLNIKSLNLNYQDVNIVLPGDNILTQVGSYEMIDGSIRTMGDVNFSFNGFYSEFTDNLKVTQEVSQFINIKGSGRVNELHQAMMKSSELFNIVEQFSVNKSSYEQRELIFKLLKEWAKTDINYQEFNGLIEKSTLTDLSGNPIGGGVDYEEVSSELKLEFEQAKVKIGIIDSFIGLKTNGLYYRSEDDIKNTILSTYRSPMAH